MINNILQEIADERERQDAKWGEQNHAPAEWLMILGEEVGEANKAALETFFGYKNADKNYANYRAELVQVAAVAVAMIDCLDRKAANEHTAAITEKFVGSLVAKLGDTK